MLHQMKVEVSRHRVVVSSPMLHDGFITDEDNTLAGLPPTRIESLADGIFAVAMTLLVLELHVPNLARDAANASSLGAAVFGLWPKVAAYAVGFLILGTLWIGHHYQFHYIKRTDRRLLWINLVFLLTISFLPFAVALVGSYGAFVMPVVIYGVALIIAGACLLGQWIYATSNHRLVSKQLDASVIRALRGRVLAGIVGYGAGLGFAFIEPRISLVFYVAMPLFYVLPGRIDRQLEAT
jgi:uncharacterized membrane protein